MRRLFLSVCRLTVIFSLDSFAVAAESYSQPSTTLVTPLLACIVFAWVQKIGKGRTPIIRNLLALLAAVCVSAIVGAGPKLIDNYINMHDPESGQKAFEKTVFASFPFFKIIAATEPLLWEKVRNDSVAMVQAHGGKIDADVVAEMIKIVGPLNTKQPFLGSYTDASCVPC